MIKITIDLPNKETAKIIYDGRTSTLENCGMKYINEIKQCLAIVIRHLEVSEGSDFAKIGSYSETE